MTTRSQPAIQQTHLMTTGLSMVFSNKKKITFAEATSNTIPGTLFDANNCTTWLQATTDAYTALQQKNTWTLVPYQPSMNLVGCKWVFQINQNPDGSILKYKVKLVTKGFNQIVELDYYDTFSPIVKGNIISVIFALVVSYR